MCCGLIYYCIRQMSFKWGRRSYRVSSSQGICLQESTPLGSRIIPNTVAPLSTVTVGPVFPIIPELTVEPVPPPPPARRQSQLISVSISGDTSSVESETSPPPLPPRRRPPLVSQLARPVTTIFAPNTIGGVNNPLQLPPSSVLPIFERNASIRNSRMMSTENHPFVCLRYPLNELAGQDTGMGFMPLWTFTEEDDEPPSYDEAMKMQVPAEGTREDITKVQRSQEQVLRDPINDMTKKTELDVLTRSKRPTSV